MRYLNSLELKKAVRKATDVYVLVPVTLSDEVYVQITKVEAEKLAAKIDRANVTWTHGALYIGDSERVLPSP